MRSLSGGASAASQSSVKVSMALTLIKADQRHPDVIYNSSTGLWACCGSNGDESPDCTHSTSETFNLAPPEDLIAYFSIPATGFSFRSVATSTISRTSATTIPSLSATTTTSCSSTTTTPCTTEPAHGSVGWASTSTSTSTSGSGGLTSGAAAGIGIGAVLGCVISAGLAVWLYRRRQRRKHTGMPFEGASVAPSGATSEQYPVSQDKFYYVQTGPSELNAVRDPNELPASRMGY